MAHNFVPLTDVEARTWLEIRGRDKELLELFGDTEEEDEIDEVAEARVLLRLPPTLARRVKNAAQHAGMTRHKWIQNILDIAASGEAAI